ncbi:hypothetical protein [Pedobacter sp. SYSU D00535]|uniref:hypothetical protein n=1 Tax=Pedobacter sp. SYSU D00535 TaxID=2810308 RepID=UPI001A960451|nr:hypothetical protein [Pedobacter sp. SYSU D00535]
MKRGFIITLISFVVVLAFGKQIKRHCASLMCSDDFKIVSVRFKDALGNPIAVKDFKAVNLRTRQSMVVGSVTDTMYSKGNYTIASDLHVKKVSEEGDTIIVSGIHPDSNIGQVAKLVIARDDCSCHVAKLAGPEEIVFH